MMRGQAIRRRGATLLLFAALLFALLGIAALVIDLGMAIQARGQMQSAVETTALEGLRGFDPDDPEATDEDSRSDARALLFQVFDDDLDPGNGDLLHYGAGPVLSLTGGIPLGDSSFHASALLTVPQPRVYDPFDLAWPFQLNLENDSGGDMVRGVFKTASQGDPILHKEKGDYTRDDFEPAEDGPALLVRLRRSDEGSADGSRSSGPVLPYLFGRGTMMGLEAKARGITVRATAIAQGKPAMSAGPAYPSSLYPDFAGRPGLAPFALTHAFWVDLNSAEVKAEADGTLTANATVVGHILRATSLDQAINDSETTLQVKADFPNPSLPFRIRIGGELLKVTAIQDQTWTVQRGLEETQPAAHSPDQPILLQEDLTIGPRLAQLAVPHRPQLHLLEERPLHVHVPILKNDRVIGFGKVSWITEDGITLNLAKRKSRTIAPNTSAVPSRSPRLFLVDLADGPPLDGFFQDNLQLLDSLLSPALVR